MFSFAVSPIEPNERKRVEVSYGQWLPREANTIEFSAPVTKPGRRDHPDGLGRARSSQHHVADTRHRRPAPRLRALRRPLSPRRRVGGRAGRLRYEIVDQPRGRSPASCTGTRGKTATSRSASRRPRCPRTAIAPKDVTLVIDRSGSMAGETIRQARAACVDIMRRLRAADRLNVIAVRPSRREAVQRAAAATEAVRNQAIEFVELMDDGGGTNLAAALERGAGQPAPSRRPPARRPVLHRRPSERASGARSGRRRTKTTCACSPSASARR